MILDPSKGYYDYGQSIIPANLTNAVQLAGGEWHSLALKANGTLEGWGDDTSGQTDFPTNDQYVAIACGGQHSLALESNGIVVASAGDDGYGQVDVPGGLSNVVAIACGFYHSLALKSDGTMVAWGAYADVNPVGDSPNYGQTIVPSGLSNVVAIAAGGYHSLALKADGTLAEWGDENSSEIPPGISNVVAIATGAVHNVALMAGGTLAVWGTNTYGQTNIPAGLSNVVAIAAGSWHTLALEKNGTVVAWGAGMGTNFVAYGQNLVPSGLSNVVEVAAGWVHSLALKGSAPPVLQTPLTIEGLGTNGFNLAASSSNGRIYQLEYASSLGNATRPTNAIWTALPLQFGTGGMIEFDDPAGAAAPQRFYRLNRW